MKMTNIFPVIIGAVFLLSSTVVTAGEHQIPTAPDDYLSKTNPVSVDDADAIKEAGKLYKGKCKKCHGSKGDGHGPGAEDMNPMPTAFNVAGFLKGRKDGQLFWIIEKGSKGTEMGAFGPGSEANLSEDDIWKVVAYMRSEFTK
ncbi:MAG: c-type cytochrome [Gammaproteobacteria bacterium]|nr:c-type cytochrome [Gammaproteobacteria bacterium]